MVEKAIKPPEPRRLNKEELKILHKVRRFVNLLKDSQVVFVLDEAVKAVEAEAKKK